MKEDRYKKIVEFQSKIGISLSNIDIIDIALTHSSYANENKQVKFNERLEFLGDSVLQLSVTHYLFKNLKDKPEGELSKIRSLVVCENSLYEVCKKWNTGEYVLMSKGEELTGGREKVSLLADCMEAIIAAIYIDKGYEYANEFIISNFMYIIDKAINNKLVFDYKSKLQELLQKKGEVDIQYNLVGYEGPPHKRKFFVEVSINKNVCGNGSGFSKKEAEQNAAKRIIEGMEEGYEQ